VVERLAPLLAPSEVEVAIADGLPAVLVDAIFIDQTLTNLLENAARYATGKGIRITAGEMPDGGVEMVVEDAGPGVPGPAMAHLFERFYRGPRRQGSRSEGGSGIGLAVVKGLVEAMGGSVEARPSELGGLAVAVRLPVESAPEPAEPIEPAKSADPAAKSADGAVQSVESAVEPAAQQAAAEPQ
jgi:signal transduction histidine kinase